MSLPPENPQDTIARFKTHSSKNPGKVYRDAAGRHYWNGDMFKSKSELDMLVRIMQKPLLQKLDKFFTRMGNFFSRKKKQ
ncbi:MAG: hypothetical protein M3Q56_09635 [Bacteroidota bacterium]|nr:hypothetical protein [Bacteroidota bacterium]